MLKVSAGSAASVAGSSWAFKVTKIYKLSIIPKPYESGLLSPKDVNPRPVDKYLWVYPGCWMLFKSPCSADTGDLAVR